MCVKDKDNSTPLHWAARYGRLQCCKSLLTGGASPNAENKEGYNPLHFAAGNGHSDVVLVLVNSGTSVNSLGNVCRASHLPPPPAHIVGFPWLVLTDLHVQSGWTALHLAVHYGHIECVRVLLKNKAAANYKIEGTSSYDSAIALLFC